MVDLYALNFLNYYDRRVIRKGNVYGVQEYSQYIIGSNLNVNFRYEDGVETFATMQDLTEEPNYVLVVEQGTGKVQSRWYVREAHLNTYNKYQLTLRRDLLADFLGDIIRAPAFINRAMIRDTTNNLIFNSEGNTYNQIKTGEEELRDRVGCPWIAMYVDPTATFDISVDASATEISDIQINSWDSWQYAGHIIADDGTAGEFTPLKTYPSKARVTGCCNRYAPGGGGALVYPGYITTYYGWNDYGNPKTPWQGQDEIAGLPPNPFHTYKHEGISFDYRRTGWKQRNDDIVYDTCVLDTAKQKAGNTRRFWTDMIAALLGCENPQVTSGIYDLDGKTIRVGTGPENYAYYRLQTQRTQVNWDADADPHTAPPDSLLFEQVAECMGDVAFSTDNHVPPRGKAVEYQAAYMEVKIIATKLDTPQISGTLGSGRKGTQDAPYDLIAIPFANMKLKQGESIIRTTKSSATDVLRDLILGLGTKLYDVQLLPYCPVPVGAHIDGGIDLDKLAENKDYNLVKDAPELPATPTIYTALFYCPMTNFSVSIKQEWKQPPTNAVDFKVMHETEFYRIVSPNYNGSFDIKVTSNRGITAVYANCTYKPFSPYIHVAPFFEGLYGGDFEDARGLICGGDFSMDTMSDPWQQFQINNKNFQNIFDREVKNLEVTQKYERVSQIAGAVAGTLQGGTSAGMGGAMVGGPIGAGVGAAVGGITAGAAGVVDYQILRKLQGEAMSMRKDLFRMNLGNIQALPYNLTKVTAYNVQNKIFPFMEHYEATEEERNALRAKIKYTSMNVGVIGTIAEYWQPTETFISANLIRIGDIKTDYHMAVEIANELADGIYIVSQSPGGSNA